MVIIELKDIRLLELYDNGGISIINIDIIHILT